MFHNEKNHKENEVEQKSKKGNCYFFFNFEIELFVETTNFILFFN